MRCTSTSSTPPTEHICMASLPGMFEHTITCNSLSKTYSITGWRLGYLIGPAEVIEGCPQGARFPDCGRGRTLAGGRRRRSGPCPQSYYEGSARSLYREARPLPCRAGLPSACKHNVPQGTYFVMIDISDFLALPQFKGWTDLEFCEWMIKEHRCGGCPRFELLQRAGQPPHPDAFCPRHRRAGRGGASSGKADGAAEI